MIMIKNFDKIDFNRQVDALVGLYVFDMLDVEVEWFPRGNSGYWSAHYWVPAEDGEKLATEIPCYSTLLTSSWDLIRKYDYTYLFRKKGWRDSFWECKLVEYDLPQYYGWAETEQLAICYAGLKAVGFDVKGFLRGEGA